jgi:hypothetical protein
VALLSSPRWLPVKGTLKVDMEFRNIGMRAEQNSLTGNRKLHLVCFGRFEGFKNQIVLVRFLELPAKPGHQFKQV